MLKNKLDRIKNDNGFIAAMDQSGNSTPNILETYGIPKNSYETKDEMFDLVHKMRTRIIFSPTFKSDYILGTILFEQTMDRTIEGMYTGDYLAEEKGIVPFLKIDKGLADIEDGVQMMKPIDDLDDKLKRANKRNIFGTKERSVIQKANEKGIQKIVEQQFEIGQSVLDADLVPIVEPEVDINSPDKEKCEEILEPKIREKLDNLKQDEFVMLKLSIPSVANKFKELIEHPNVLRVVALSGGYDRDEANEKLKENSGLIASFARALIQDLHVDQTDDEFNAAFKQAIESTYHASIQ